VGFDALYFSRIDYQDRAKRKDTKSLEVIWRGSKSLGSSADVYFCLSFFLSSFALPMKELILNDSSISFFSV
jgi:Glycosyl hydrolases family 38 N-terminal domain